MAYRAKGMHDALLKDFQKPWPSRLSHQDHLDRCLKTLPDDWKPGDPYPKKWTGGDIAAWELEAYRLDTARHMMRVIRQSGNVKAMELYYKVIGTPETKPGVGVQVNINKQTRITGVKVTVIAPPSQPQLPAPAYQLPQPNDIVEGELVPDEEEEAEEVAEVEQEDRG